MGYLEYALIILKRLMITQVGLAMRSDLGANFRKCSVIDPSLLVIQRHVGLSSLLRFV